MCVCVIKKTRVCVYVNIGVVLINILVPQLGPPYTKIPSSTPTCGGPNISLKPHG